MHYLPAIIYKLSYTSPKMLKIKIKTALLCVL